MRKPRILVVDDNEPMLELLATILSNYDVTTAATGQKATLAVLDPQGFEVALVDVRLPSGDGHEVLKAMKAASPTIEVVMMTAYATVKGAVAGMREGAFDYLEKPFDPDDVSLVVARALDARRQKKNDAARRIERGPGSGEGAGDVTAAISYREALEAGRDRTSRAYLVALMTEFGGNVTEAAERAGMERESLHRLLRRYEIRAQDFKRGSRNGAAGPGPRVESRRVA